jgi:hypothetical protein
MSDYFKYYTVTAGFIYAKRLNLLQNFEKLARHLNWDEETYWVAWKDFFTYLRENHMPIFKELTTKDFFKYFKDTFGIYITDDYRCALGELIEALALDSEDKAILSTYYQHTLRNDLKEVIRYYNLCDERDIPMNIKGCRAMLEEMLFANINDFIAQDKIKFENAEELANYTQETGKWFPREIAKKNIKYRSLLRQLVLNNVNYKY